MFRPGILKLAFALAPAVFAILSLGTFAPARAAVAAPAAAPAAAAPAAAGTCPWKTPSGPPRKPARCCAAPGPSGTRSPRATSARRCCCRAIRSSPAGPARGAKVRRPTSSVSAGLQYFVHAEQTVEIGGQRSARRAVVSRALHTAELRVQVARAETRARVRAAYVGTQLALALRGRRHPARGPGDEAARCGARARRGGRVVERRSRAGAAGTRQRGAGPHRRDAGRGRRGGAGCGC